MREQPKGPDRPPEKIDYSQRHRKLEWRTRWFHLDRSWDDRELERTFDKAYRHKLSLLERQRQTAKDFAAYGPPGAGSPWFSIGPRNINGRVKSLAVHPTDSDILYAGAASGGVWKSEDGGQSWRALWNAQESLIVGSLAIAPSDPDTIYVGTGEWTPGYVAAGPGAGVYVSNDGGDTWTRRDSVIARRIARVVVSQSDPLRVYVAGENGFERSTDGGMSWTTVRAGQISDAVIDPNNADILYINVRSDGIYKSENGGDDWDKLTAGPTGAGADWIKLAIGDSGTHGSQFLLAKRSGTIHKTTDGGTGWTTLAGSHGSAGHHTWANLIAVAPDDENIILAGGVGIERTSTGGTAWSGLGVLHADHHVAVFAPSDTDIVYACNDGGLYRSEDKGATWKKASHGLVITQFYDVGSWSQISTVVGGGTQDQGTTMTTGGLTWRHIQNTHDGGYFAISPTDPRTIYEEFQNTVIHKSTDGGNSWVEKTGGLSGGSPWVGVIAMHPSDHNILYTGTNRVYRTTDGCATNWVASSQVLAGSVSSIAIAPSSPSRVYAAASNRIYRSDDGGATSPWADKTTATLPGRPLKDIAVDPDTADRVALAYGGTTGSGTANHVFLSTNGGNDWTDISGNLPDISVNAVILDPNSDNTVYAGTDVGVYRTTDLGGSWELFDNGLPNVIISDLHIDPEDNALYAATFGCGMYKLNIAPGASEPSVDLYLRDSVLDVGERFPSPGGLPHPNDVSDIVEWWESPDIKVEVSPFYTPDAVFDGVEFDEEVVHDDPERAETNRFYLQVHNRGWEATTAVRVRAFFASAHAGLPNLPNALTPPDFNLTSTADWQPIGPARDIPLLLPNRPVVVSWDWSVPVDAQTHSCLLAVVSSADDPITTTETNVGNLVTSEKRVCLKNLHVVNSAGPRPAMEKVAIKFHNAKETADRMDIVIHPVDLAAGVIGMLLEPVHFADPGKALDGVGRYEIGPDENLGNWYDRPGTRKVADRSEIWEKLDRSVVYEFDPSKVSALRGIEIGPKQTIQAVIAVKGTHKIPYGRTQKFTVAQIQDGRVVGGSTYEIRLPRAEALRPVSRIRVILEKVRILDDHEPFFKGRGDFHFLSLITFNDDPCRRHWHRLPQKGVYKIGDRPGRNEQELGVCVFDGYVSDEDSMQISILPVEHDWPDADDTPAAYKRRFPPSPATWVGRYRPDDESPAIDPERLSDWMLWYRIESVKL